MKPKTLILRTAGTNCDGETTHAFERAGSDAQAVHVNRLLQQPALLDAFQILAVPGGFSYGDDIAAGRILANQIAHHLSDALRRFVETGRPVIGVCNGFQVLVKTNLLPGNLAGRAGQTCTLAHNDNGRFVDRWVHVKAHRSNCIWTKGLAESDADAASPPLPHFPTPPLLHLPVAHGEGKFVPIDEGVRNALWADGHVALTYATAAGAPAAGAFPDNPNGSTDDIAGVCDASGLVFGLMPHPERYVDPLQHPAWTSQRLAKTLPAEGQGLQIFRNAVQHVRQGVGAGV